MHRSSTDSMTRPRAMVACMLAMLLAGFAPLALAFNVYTVGADAACGYSAIQDAVNAAAANPGEDYIWIANNQIYSNQNISIVDQDVIIEGGFTDCSQVEPTGTTTLRDSVNRVFDIEGSSNVQLGYLGLTGSVGDADYGGAIYFGGSGSLTLVETSVLSSEAGYGGGIAMSPTSASTLSLQQSYVAINTAAHDGGGLWLRDTTFSIDSSSQIFGNTTSDTSGGRGGGMFLGGPVTAYVNSTIFNNSAGWGGGVYTYGQVDVNLYSTDATAGVAIFGNAATNGGGGLYLYARTTAASLCARDFQISTNTAHDGAAFQTDGPSANVYLNDDAHSCLPASPPVAPATCDSVLHCNEIASNVSQQSDGTPTGGSTVVIGTGGGNTGSMTGNRFAARNNQAGAFIYANDYATSSSGSQSVTLSNCLIADNNNSYYDIWADGGADNTQLILDSCTIANNTEQGGIMIYGLAHDVQIMNSILDTDNDAVTIYYYLIAGTNTVQYDLSSGTSIGGTGIMYGLPSFVDPVNGNYHLLPTSLGVDYAPAMTGTDLDGNPRTVDLPDIPNDYGPLDLGAYEIQADVCSTSDTIFCNGFE